jgi:hypothetical protein
MESGSGAVVHFDSRRRNRRSFAQGQRGRTIRVPGIRASASRSVGHRSQVESESNRTVRILTFSFEP